MYEKYYSKNKKIIVEGLLKWKKEEKSIAVWGAGRRCIEFLMIYDSHAKYIDCIFDINLKKCGEVLPTGHKVYDYRYTNIDVVIFIDPINTNESIMELMMVNSSAHICCLENVFFGNFTLVDDMMCEVDKTFEKASKIFSITILYNPTDSVIKNVKTYCSLVDKLFLFDNSPKCNEYMFEELIECDNVEYIWNGGENKGIGTPINETVSQLSIDNNSWIITFDQDSEILPDTILKMREYVESKGYNETIGLVAPFAKNLLRKKFPDEVFQKLPYLTYKQEVMQSGAMHRLDILHEIGGYDNELFIDQVDYEYCARCRANGYKIVQLNRAFMLHQTEDENHIVYSEGKNILVDKYSPKRFYYQIRNQLYLARKYKKIDPIYSEECMRGYEFLIKLLKYESERDEKSRLLKRAEKDAELGILGKYNG